MSQQVVSEIIQKAATDPVFRRQLLTDPDGTLKPYLDRQELSAEESSAIKAIKESMWEGVSSALTREVSRKWWQPTTFRDFAGAVLTLFIAIGLGVVLAWVIDLFDTPPSTYKLGTTDQTYDPFQRSKDILLVVLPIFTSAMAFWLGVSTEGRRADSAEDQAGAAQQQADQATQRASESDARVTAVLDQSDKNVLEDAAKKFPGLFPAWTSGGGT